MMDTANLQTFLRSEVLTSGCSLYLPKFTGNVILEDDSSPTVGLTYPGRTFSDRDTKAALYITSVLGQVLESDKIELKETSGFEPVGGLPDKTAFLFGSRSNEITIWATENLPTRKFFTFRFNDNWEIVCEDGKTFSTPDPSALSRDSYSSQTDYGVVARISDSAGEEQVFVIAGLGSRATEGCGYYFSRHWRELFTKYGSNDFAVILKFNPPLDPKRHEPVAWFGDQVSSS